MRELLPPIKESTEDYDAIEKKIRDHFKKEIYLPIIRELGARKTIINSLGDLLDAIRFGKIRFYRGSFRGQFSAATSRELKNIGAQWDRSSATWKLPSNEHPIEIKLAIQASRSNFEQKIAKIDKKLAAVGELKVDLTNLFDTALWKTDRKFKQNVKNISVAPQLTKEQRKTIAAEWQKNMDLFIKGFTEQEIIKLRKSLQETIFSGDRYESAIQTIMKSYDVSANKAKFLARQETGLLMSKFKEVRYKDIGINVYQWNCVAGTAKHPVRPDHKACNGKFFTWDGNYEVDKTGKKKVGGQIKPGADHDCNPGEDYNCRCYSRPVIKF